MYNRPNIKGLTAPKCISDQASPFRASPAEAIAPTAPNAELYADMKAAAALQTVCPAADVTPDGGHATLKLTLPDTAARHPWWARAERFLEISLTR